MCLQAAIGDVAAVAGKGLALWQTTAGTAFVWVAEDELARLQRGAGAGCRLLTSAFDDRLREPVAIAKVVVRITERRCGLQVQRREHFHALASRDEFVMLRLTPCALRAIAGEKDDDGVKVRTCQTAHPVGRTIGAGVTENFRAGHHALLELFWK